MIERRSVFAAMIVGALALTILGTTAGSFAQDANQTQTQTPSASMNATTSMPDGNTTIASSNNTLSGIIASLQADRAAAPTWIAGGNWTLESNGDLFTNETQANVTNFQATIHMILVANGTAGHGHVISNFRQTNITHLGGNVTIIDGTFAVTLDGEPRENVHGFITLENSKIAIWINPVESDNHFGITPVYGMILGPEQTLEHEKMRTMQQNATSAAIPGGQNTTAGP
ncbi:MAG TPA: hypothetical protein VNI77_09535 [Nitrososphaera sp.]|nr:hypothetical protein [Nitrososphaera sp.]